MGRNQVAREIGVVLLVAAVLVGLGACADPDRQQSTAPSFSPASPQYPGRGLAQQRFPDMVEFLPAVRIARSYDPLPPELSDAELVEDVARAGGSVFIGLKPAAAQRTRETGEVPAIDRATALAARAIIRALGAEITMTYRHSSAVVAAIPPELAPRLRRLPVVDYVEAVYPGGVQAMTVLQDTSWGVKKVYAPWVWSGAYGPATRGEGAFVTILDGGVDEIHRWSGDGPENMYSDCYYIAPAAPDSSCYGGANGHGAHIAGIIASRDDEQGYIGIANSPERFASIRVCNSAGICNPSWVVAGLE